MAKQTKAHWERAYKARPIPELSWHQDVPATSLRFVEKTAVSHEQAIIDVGGGAFSLADHLLTAGFKQISVLDISATALQHGRDRLGDEADKIEWVEADITNYQPTHKVDVWHDRAVFHFLTNATDRTAYLQTMGEMLHDDGHVIISTFALDGPEQCSALNIVRYDADMMCAEFGEQYRLLETCKETHPKPRGGEQEFIYFWFQRQT